MEISVLLNIYLGCGIVYAVLRYAKAEGWSQAIDLFLGIVAFALVPFSYGIYRIGRLRRKHWERQHTAALLAAGWIDEDDARRRGWNGRPSQLTLADFESRKGDIRPKRRSERSQATA